MKKTLWLAALVVGLATPALAAQNQMPRQISQKDQQKLMDLQKDREQAMNQQNAEELAKLYTTNGTARDLHGQTARGPQQIRQQAKSNAEQMKEAKVSINVTSVEPIDSKTALIESDRRVTGASDESMNMVSHEVAVARKEGNKWKLVATREFAAGGPGVGGAGQQEPSPSEEQMPPEPMPSEPMPQGEEEPGTGGAGQHPPHQTMPPDMNPPSQSP